MSLTFLVKETVKIISMVSILPNTIITLLGSNGKQRPKYQLGVYYRISLQIRPAAPEEVSIIESSMRKETSL